MRIASEKRTSPTSALAMMRKSRIVAAAAAKRVSVRYALTFAWFIAPVRSSAAASFNDSPIRTGTLRVAKLHSLKASAYPGHFTAWQQAFDDADSTRMPNRANKLTFFGTLLLLLAVLVGPALQMRDCFNNAPNHDHDVTLHLVAAVLCVAMFTALAGTSFSS